MRDLLVLGAAFLAVTSCGGDDNAVERCPPCMSPAAFITVYSSMADVTEMTLSGAACQNPHFYSSFVEDAGPGGTVSSFAPGAIQYSITIPQAAAGQCVIEVVLTNGQPLQKAFTITRNAGCCETYSVSEATWSID